VSIVASDLEFPSLSQLLFNLYFYMSMSICMCAAGELYTTRAHASLLWYDGLCPRGLVSRRPHACPCIHFASLLFVFDYLSYIYIYIYIYLIYM